MSHQIQRRIEYGVQYGNGDTYVYIERGQAEEKIAHIQKVLPRLPAGQQADFEHLTLVEREIVTTASPWKPVEQ